MERVQASTGVTHQQSEDIKDEISVVHFMRIYPIVSGASNVEELQNFMWIIFNSEFK